MPELRIGVIGMGGAGRGHARRFVCNPHVRHVLGFDPRPDTRCGFDVVTDLDGFLERVDAVSICAPDGAHFDHIRRCLEAGKHVLVEKPMVTTTAEARAVQELVAKRPDLRFAVHHQMRCVPAFVRAKSLIAEGVLGRVFYVEANYWHDMRERWMKFDTWRAEGAGQSVIFGGACHPFDLILHLVDAPLQEHRTFVSANAFTSWPGSYTASTTIFKFADGVTAKAHASFCAVYPQLNDLVVLGDRGSFVDGVLYTGDRFRDTNDYRRIARSTSWRHGLVGRLALGPLSALASGLARRLPGFRRSPLSVYEHEAACRAIVDNFVQAIVNDTEVLVGVDDGARVVALCEQAECDGLGASQPIADGTGARAA